MSEETRYLPLVNYEKAFRVSPGKKVRLKDADPDFAHGSKEAALKKTEELRDRLGALQFRLYAERKHSLLVCLQALDAGGKDGVVRHVVGSMNPQGCRVVPFKQPSSEELAHDFLWRIEKETPRRGEIVIFNRSHYEDVLVTRVHGLVPKKIWSKRYDLINDFERRLAENGTHIVKLFLHIGKDEQLRRFKERLDDPARHWKISESDYSERELWNDYRKAYEDAFENCSTEAAPWYVIPSNHKWFRNLAVSRILVDTLERLHIALPQPTVDIAAIKRTYHRAVKEG